MNIEGALQELEEFICTRRYKGSPYEMGVPKKVLKEIHDTKIQELVDTLDFSKIEKYFKKNQIENSKLGTYLNYRYLLHNYEKEVKDLYISSKKSPYFYFFGLSKEEYKMVGKGKYLSYDAYPSNFQMVENTLKRVPVFEHDEIFKDPREILENIKTSKRLGIHPTISKNNFLYVDTLFVGNPAEFKRKTGLKGYKFYNSKKDSPHYRDSYNLYEFIYSEEIKQFLKTYDYYFKNCHPKIIQEFYQKTGLKLQYLVKDKYRYFYFDIYGVQGTDLFGRDCYDAGEYAKFEYEKWDDMLNDYDLRIIVNVAYVDYDDDKNIYYQFVHDVWDPYYEDGMSEEEKQELSGEESDRIYLFEKDTKI